MVLPSGFIQQLKHTCGFIFFLQASLLGAQNYIEYQHTFNRIDQDVFNSNYAMANERLDSIQQQYSFIYARHCIKALQICCQSNDSLRADQWLIRCFQQGVPLWLIRINGLTQKSLEYSTTQHTLAHHDSLHAVYLSHIHTHLAKLIDSMYVVDQQLTNQLNAGCLLCYFKWRKNNARHFSIIRHITDSLGFPGEKLIGLPPYFQDSSQSANNLVFYGPNVFDQRAQIMVIHYLSDPRKSLDDVFYNNIVTGYLPAEHYGAFSDFVARWGRKKPGERFYYNVWHHDPHQENIACINLRRTLIGLNLTEQQEKNMLINRERRKNKIANTEIITE